MTRDHKTRARTARLLTAVVLVVPLASCLSATDNNSNLYQYGAMTVRGLGGAATQVNATTNGVFFSALTASIPDSRLVQNSCAFSAVDTTNPVPKGDLRAGASVTLLTGTGSIKTTVTLPLNTTNTSYVGASGFTYKAGDSATVSVPGEAGGFPASSVTVKLAEPIIPQDIIIPLANDNMLVRWNVGDSTSAIILSIKYANPMTATYANEQVVCSLRDDGAEDILATALGPFLLSPVAKRSVKITRWRTNAVQSDTRALLHVVSTVDSTAKLK